MCSDASKFEKSFWILQGLKPNDSHFLIFMIFDTAELSLSLSIHTHFFFFSGNSIQFLEIQESQINCGWFKYQHSQFLLIKKVGKQKYQS